MDIKKKYWKFVNPRNPVVPFSNRTQFFKEMIYRITLLLFVLMISCDSKEIEPENDLVGKWRLIEVYADPGDGSGEYNPVTSDKTIEFKNNGQFLSNGQMCHVEIEPSAGSKGSYSIDDKTLTPDNCEFAVDLPFEFQGSLLIIHHFCIEGCGEKYEKVE